MNVIYRFSLAFLRAFLLPYWPTRLDGLQNLPQQGPVILCSNHPTIIDGLVLGTVLPRQVRFLVSKEAMSVPLVGRWLKALGFITVQRGKNSVESASQYLAEGSCLGIYPEATPTHSYELRQFKTGVAALARVSQAPVIPTAILGTEQLCSGDARFARSGPVLIRFGEPISCTAEETVEEFRDRIQDCVRGLLDCPYPTQKPRRNWRYWLSALLWVPLSWLLFHVADNADYAGKR